MLGLSGCSTLGYLFQAGRGQLALWNHSRSIDAVLKDPRTAPRLRELLSEIPRIKKFGEAHGLKPTANYRDYVQLDRPAVVWVVSASDKLKFRPKEWSFPLVGGFTYLGWFARRDADKYGEGLREEGWDVDVRGASAYSTLGWFNDPILSTMISSGEEAMGDLVDVVLHESLHATIYVKNQSYFNESLASFVADRMTPIYLRERQGLPAGLAEAFEKAEAQHKERGHEFQKAYQELSALYDSARPDAEKLQEKARIYGDLKTTLKASRELNNATLIQFRTYGVGEKEFTELFEACGKDWGRFLAAAHSITSENFSKPQQEDLGPVLSSVTKSCRGF